MIPRYDFHWTSGTLSLVPGWSGIKVVGLSSGRMYAIQRGCAWRDQKPFTGSLTKMLAELESGDKYIKMDYRPKRPG
jgi:hypothetical protein